MRALTKNQSAFLIFAMSAMMWLTRGHHIASLAYLPDASWAIFFAVGFYFTSFAVITLFLVQACLIDYLVISQLGIGQSCFTMAYAFLLPSYLSMWFAGKWFSKRCALNLVALKNFFLAAVLGVLICELISSGSYYFINAQEQTSMIEFATRIIYYLPFAMVNTLAYLLAALALHLVVLTVAHKTALFQKNK